MIDAKKTIQSLTPYEADCHNEDFRLKLDHNENICSTPNYIISAIKNFDFEKVAHYSNFEGLIDLLASKYYINKKQFLLTNGCDEAINLILSAYLEKDDEILSYTPTYPMLANYAAAQEAKHVAIKYKEKYKFDIETVQNSINEKTKIFYCATPNNPTGNITRASEVAILIEKFQDVLFVIDCSYISYASNITIEDYFDLIEKFDNVIVIKSFSLDYAIAGLRLGFVCAKKHTIYNLKKIKSPHSVNAIAAYCGYVAMKNEECFEEIKALNISAKELLFDGLAQKGFKPYYSEANFILCDFYDYADFYYQKFKNHGIIVKKFPKSSDISTCLRITIPKIGGAKYILELLNKKDMLIFNLEDVIFDVKESYDEAVVQTFRHFSGYEIPKSEVLRTKNLSGYNQGWNISKYLLNCHGFNIEADYIADIFQNLYYNPHLTKQEFLIDKEKLLISEETFEELSNRYDMVIFTDRLRAEVDYSLKKYNIDKFFCYIVSANDLPLDLLKPNPQGVLEILKHCPHKSIKYIAGSVDDVIAGNSANVYTIGVIRDCEEQSEMVNNYKHLCVNSILEDINKLTNFLEENEQN